MYGRSQNSLCSKGRTMYIFNYMFNNSFKILFLVDNQPITEQLLIGTPGKMVEWMIKQRKIDAKKIIAFALDEADSKFYLSIKHIN